MYEAIYNGNACMLLWIAWSAPYEFNFAHTNKFPKSQYKSNYFTKMAPVPNQRRSLRDDTDEDIYLKYRISDTI